MSRFPTSEEQPAPRFTLRALMGYGAVWVAMTAAVALAFIALADGDESVTLPPVRATELTGAARAAGCGLRQGDRPDVAVPVSGPAGMPARPGFYEKPPRVDALLGALRRGVIVIHYRTDLPSGRLGELREVQRSVPAGTIVTPNEGMRYVVAVTSWRRLLGCAEMTDRTLDALRLFHGRYVGRAVDSP